VGITTQHEALQARIDVEIAAERVANFLIGTRAVLEDYLRVMGLESVAEFGPWDLIPLTPAATAILGD
jgi:glutamate synthase domain-containing protein 2